MSDVCKVCGRKLEDCALGQWVLDPGMVMTPTREQAEDCYRLGYDRERARADAAECAAGREKHRADSLAAAANAAHREYEEWITGSPNTTLASRMRHAAGAARAAADALAAEKIAREAMAAAFLERFKPLSIREMFQRDPPAAIRFWDEQGDAFCSNAQSRALAAQKRVEALDSEWSDAVRASGLMLSPDSDNPAWHPLCDLLARAALAPPSESAPQEQLSGAGVMRCKCGAHWAAEPEMQGGWRHALTHCGPVPAPPAPVSAPQDKKK